MSKHDIWKKRSFRIPLLNDRRRQKALKGRDQLSSSGNWKKSDIITRTGKLRECTEVGRRGKRWDPISFRHGTVKTYKWKYQQAVGNMGVERGEGVRARDKDLKDFGIRTTGLNSPKKEEEQEAEDRNVGTCPLWG